MPAQHLHRFLGRQISLPSFGREHPPSSGELQGPIVDSGYQATKTMTSSQSVHPCSLELAGDNPSPDSVSSTVHIHADHSLSPEDVRFLPSRKQAINRSADLLTGDL